MNHLTGGERHLVTFDLTKVGMTLISSAQLRTSPYWQDDIEGQLIHSLEAYVCTNHRVVASKTVTLRETVQFSFPTTWWDHFRSTHWRWTRRRWPVGYTNHTREVQKTEQVDLHSDLLYPQADLPIERLGRPIIFEHYSSRTP